MQSPTYIPAEMAAQVVAGHEQEHVRNNAEKAQREGLNARSVVQIHTAICPECGRIYVSGGTTTTYYSTKEPLAGDESKGFNINVMA